MTKPSRFTSKNPQPGGGSETAPSSSIRRLLAGLILAGGMLPFTLPALPSAQAGVLDFAGPMGLATIPATS